MIRNFLQQEYFGNNVLSYLIALGILLLILLFIRIMKFVVLKRMERWAKLTKSTVDDFIVLNSNRFLVPILYLCGVYFGYSYLKVSPGTAKIVDSILVIITTFFAIRFIAAIINYSIRLYWNKKNKIESGEGELKGLSTFISLIVWSIGLVFVLDNLGVQITAVLTGLGIGGIAVALAAQTILGDLFNYFVIFFDRPFEIGDFIVVDDKMGVVERIGIKTTRLNSLGGEQLIFSNSNLANARIHNYKRMENRRVLFKFCVTYQTPLEKLKQIPSIIKNIIEENKNVKFDRAHFQAFGDFSLNFEVVYYVLTPDYNKFMDIQQNINYRIYEEFELQKIEFAYPTQVLHIDKAK